MTTPRLVAATALAAMLGATFAFAVHHAWIAVAVLMLPISVLAAGLQATRRRFTR